MALRSWVVRGSTAPRPITCPGRERRMQQLLDWGTGAGLLPRCTREAIEVTPGKCQPLDVDGLAERERDHANGHLQSDPDPAAAVGFLQVARTEERADHDADLTCGRDVADG